MNERASKTRQPIRPLLLTAALGVLIAMAALFLTVPLPSAASQPTPGDNELPPLNPIEPPASVTVKPTMLSITEDRSDTYSVVLDSQPDYEVRITPSSGGGGAVSVTPALRSFTADNWSTPQTFTVSGVADEDFQDESVSIIHRASSQDSRYNEITVDSVSVAVQDNTPRNFSISAAANAAEGEDVALTITLSAPDGAVEFGVSAAFDVGAGNAERSDVGDVPRTITVAAGEKTAVLTIPILSDALAEGDETFTVTFTPPTGWTPAASGGNTVTVTITDVAPPSPEPVELPGPVAGLELTATLYTVTVTWQAPASGGAPDNYIVHLRPEGGEEGSGRTRRPEVGELTTTFRHLENGVTYKVWARAENAGGKGERTRASITLPEPAPELPGPVAGLELTATTNSVTVTWQAPQSGGAPNNYIVHLRPEGSGEGSGKTKQPKKKMSFTFRHLESGKTYKVWVRAQNAGGKGERTRASVTLP